MLIFPDPSFQTGFLQVAPLPQITLIIGQFILEGSPVPSKNRPPGKVPGLSVWCHSNLQKFQPTLGVVPEVEPQRPRYGP
jgi:hypothetical protein